MYHAYTYIPPAAGDVCMGLPYLLAYLLAYDRIERVARQWGLPPLVPAHATACGAKACVGSNTTAKDALETS